MDIGICIASDITDIDYCVRAEALGYSHAWFADSQMLWSDCYACLALAATKTTTIKLGTGVAITGTRPAAVNAASIATINSLAPGRTFFGVGAGNTAMRVMGLPPQKINAFGDYLETVKPLLKGDEAEMRHQGQQIPIQHIMPDRGFVNFKDPIPMYVSGFGPRSLSLAGRYGDGAVLGMPSDAATMENIWLMLEKDRAEKLDRNQFYTTALTAMMVLDSGEAIDSERVKNSCGAMAMAALHYSYDQFRNFGHQPAAAFHEIWEDYCTLLGEYPEERRHQRIHMGHNCWVLPEELHFLTPKLLQSTCFIGTQDQLLEKLHQLSAAGLNQVMTLPNLDSRIECLERIAEDIIPFM
ncbi:MAG TPA: LLM class flavin-dependent oxidoreductase [Gammaproteobacteria bacterium]|nr:LLM class flavin-dependent oxidoreductase [Gammaproteobacteria bacterium]HIK69970.1 LLM class flavin-dependent oxidoreductase [Pseudomonadales bacterium]